MVINLLVAFKSIEILIIDIIYIF